MSVVVRQGNKTLTLPDRLLLGKGGEACVYRHPKARGVAVKVFHKHSEDMGRRLMAMTENPPRPLFEKVSRYSKEVPAFAWPLDVVWDEATSDIAGFIMPLIENKVPLRMISNPSGRVPQVTPRWLLQVSHSLAMKVYFLACSDYLIGDLNSSNALVDRHGRVCLIDLDSVYFESRSQNEVYRCLVGIGENQPPELIGVTFGDVDRERDQVAWSLLVLVHILLRYQHPFACQWVGKDPSPPSILQRIQQGIWPESGKHKDFRPHKGLVDRKRFPANFNDLCRKMFLDGHTNRQKRPSILEIVQVLDEMMKSRWR